ncbi:MAG: sulfatase-like hydrolase/transferase, partial [Planctomycetales bacterium]|nr:sulfatase-like hydrolase/transferase [Planctomycetales bacterium]
RATLLTGQYPFRHGWVNHWDVPRWGAGCHFDPQHNVTFARQLKSVGYSTCIVGKWQINDFRVQPQILREHGFDFWCMWSGWETGNPPSGERYWDPFVVTSEGFRGTKHGEFGPDVYNAYLLDFIEQHRDEPFMAYYPMALTHGPLVATPHEPDAKSTMDKHLAMVRYTDYLIGRLTAKLDELHLREKTVLVFTTDNGTSGGIEGHMAGRVVDGGKAKLTENGPRQPFIVSCPGSIPSGTITDCLTDFTDLMPTFCDLAGAPLPTDQTMDGHSLARVFFGEEKDGPREWIMAMGFGPARLDEAGVRPVKDFTERVIRNKQFKIHVNDQREVIAMFDLVNDPAENTNLLESDQPAHLVALQQLTTVLASFPVQDGRPRYEALPPQPWDMKPPVQNNRSGRRQN